MDYELTEEHRTQLPAWRDKWIKNAMATGFLTKTERSKVTLAIEGLYWAADLEPPKRIIFVTSPFVGAFAAGFAAGIWYLRKHTATEAATRAATEAATWAATSDATWAATRAATWAATSDATRAATRAATWAATWFELGGCEVRDLYKLATEFGPADFLLHCAASQSNMLNGGNQWSGWVSYLSFFRHIAKLDLDYSKWDHYEVSALAGPRWVHEEFCIVSERPIKLTADDQNRPHCDDGPFCEWADGSRLYSYHGVRVAGWILEHPEKITIKHIQDEANLETQRVMIEKYGPSRYMIDSGAKLLDMDALSLTGSAPRALFEDSSRQRWLVGTDGSTARVYHMAVAQTVKTCREAHESICGFDEARLIAEA